jgi:hypothetical protein
MLKLKEVKKKSKNGYDFGPCLEKNMFWKAYEIKSVIFV